MPLRVQGEQHRDHGLASALRTRGLSILLAGLPMLEPTQVEKLSYLFPDPSWTLQTQQQSRTGQPPLLGGVQRSSALSRQQVTRPKMALRGIQGRLLEDTPATAASAPHRS